MAQVGIRVYDKSSALLGTLWQEMTAAEIEDAITSDDEMLSAVLSDWSGDWEPSRPDLSAVDRYDITER